MKRHLKILTLWLILPAQCLGANFSAEIGSFSVLKEGFNILGQIAVSEKISLGPYLIFRNEYIDDTYVETAGAGVRGEYALTGNLFEDGIYGALFAQGTSFTGSLEYNGNSYKASGSSFGAGLGISYRWFWESFSVLLGGSYLAIHQPSETLQYNNSTGGQITQNIEPEEGGFNLEILVGLKF